MRLSSAALALCVAGGLAACSPSTGESAVAQESTVCVAVPSGEETSALVAALERAAVDSGAKFSSVSGEGVVDSLVTKGCTLVVADSVFAESVSAAARENTSVNFALLGGHFIDEDGAEETLANGTVIDIRLGEAAYLAGYASAGMTTTGNLATVGSSDSVMARAAMDGFAQGVDAYNVAFGTSISVENWNFATRMGSIVDSAEAASEIVKKNLAAGVDIVMPVGVEATSGAVDAIKTAKNPASRLVWTNIQSTDLESSQPQSGAQSEPMSGSNAQSGRSDADAQTSAPQSGMSDAQGNMDSAQSGGVVAAAHQLEPEISQSARDELGVPVLTGVYVDYEGIFADVIDDALAGALSTKPYVAAMSNGRVTLASFGPFAQLRSEEMKERLTELRRALLSTELQVQAPWEHDEGVSAGHR
ncbi:BMP family ABC transporter substrate-binding protein [Schaalia sp. ZJ1691]|uniref:BMP family lipoprotein n=1 Tax=Schaalia sp. ZJ1691 TaxID=2709404 RepID=UPI0013EDFC7E|nr:BMP family ABC transporter substrate-binding protein [Schaalia sp. ZJ1691]